MATYLLLTSYGGDGGGGGSSTAGTETSAVQETLTATGVGATGAWGSVVSITLAAGHYLLFGSYGINDNGAPLTTSIEGTITESATGVGAVTSKISRVTSLSLGGTTIYSVPSRVVSPVGPTTYHLNTRLNYLSGSPEHLGSLSAVELEV